MTSIQLDQSVSPAPQLPKGPWFYIRPFVPFMVSFILYMWLLSLDAQVTEQFRIAAERGDTNSYTGLSSLGAVPLVGVFFIFLPFEIMLLNRYTKQLLGMSDHVRKVYGWAFAVPGILLLPRLFGTLIGLSSHSNLAALGTIPVLALGLVWPFFRYGMKLLKSVKPTV